MNVPIFQARCKVAERDLEKLQAQLAEAKSQFDALETVSRSHEQETLALTERLGAQDAEIKTLRNDLRLKDEQVETYQQRLQDMEDAVRQYEAAAIKEKQATEHRDAAGAAASFGVSRMGREESTTTYVSSNRAAAAVPQSPAQLQESSPAAVHVAHSRLSGRDTLASTVSRLTRVVDALLESKQ